MHRYCSSLIFVLAVTTPRAGIAQNPANQVGSAGAHGVIANAMISGVPDSLRNQPPVQWTEYRELGLRLAGPVDRDDAEPGNYMIFRQALSTSPIPFGVRVASVTAGSLADRRGLQKYDVIWRADQTEIRTAEDFERWAASLKVESLHTLAYLRLREHRARDRINVVREWEKRSVRLVIPSGMQPEHAPLARRLDDQAAADPKRCPLEVVSVAWASSREHLKLTVLNRSRRNVIACEIDIRSLDLFGEPAGRIDHGHDRILCQEAIGSELTRTISCTLALRDTARRFEITILRVRYEDGSLWTPTRGKNVAQVFTVEE